MPIARVIATMGKAMVVLGLLILGFVAYELWGTGLHAQQAQSNLEDEYFARLDGLRSAAEGEDVDRPPTTDDGAQEPQDPFLDPDVLARLAELPPAAEGEPIGRIEIPDIGLDWWMVEGTDLSYLRDGPGHFLSTPMPGQRGNAALAGHRTTYGAPFHNIDRLEPGDEITVSTVQGKFVYEVVPIPMVDGEARWQPPPATIVLGPDDPPNSPSTTTTAPTTTTPPAAGAGDTPYVPRGAAADVDPAEVDSYAGHFIIGPNDTEILADYGDDRLTLMACHPKYSARQRIVVSARLIGPAAPTTEHPTAEHPDELPDTEAEPLLDDGGDPSARTPMVLWGLAAALVAIVASVLGRRWRRWPVYLVATPLFLGALWSFYANLDALLPAAL